MKQTLILIPFLFLNWSLSSEPVRYKLEGYEFYFFKDPKSTSASQIDMILKDFADQFESALRQESERLNLKTPGETSILIFETTSIFTRMSGQPSYIAARFIPERNRFYFQNPKILEKRNILTSLIRHEICHFLSPHQAEESLKWLEESYCEALYPTNPVVSKNLLDFPKSWEQFRKFNRKTASKKEEFKKYKLLSTWGNWILKTLGESKFRTLLKTETQEKKWKSLYLEFLKSK
ncbi:hypothetical protein AB3N59_01100 [Leptospira sp. WS92.C1]